MVAGISLSMATMPTLPPAAVLAATLLAAVLATAPETAEAHNWFQTPARALNEASTVRPCRGRKSSDTHAQVGPGQTFTLKWTVGHESPTYFVIVHESDEGMLELTNMTAVMEDYLALAPDGTNTAMDPFYQRYHGVPGRDLRTWTPHYPTRRNIYGAQVAKGDPNFLDHPRAKTESLYKFTADILEKDYRVSYASAKYPWIEGVYKYDHVDHRTFDFDGVRVAIEARKGAGHYVVNWRWNGYYDCVDVEVFDDRQIEHVDGRDVGGHTWSKLDHCQYIGAPIMLTPCMPANDGVKACIDAIGKYGDDDTRMGVNVVPLKNPSGVAFPEQVNIPFMNHTCANTEWTVVTGAVSENALPEMKERLGTAVPATTCGAGKYSLVSQGRSGTRITWTQIMFQANAGHGQYAKPTKVSLRIAMQKCGIDPSCKHISTTKASADDDIWTKDHLWYGCSQLAAAPNDPLAVAFTRPEQYNPAAKYREGGDARVTSVFTDPAEGSSDKTWRISFHPEGSEEDQALPDGWAGDTGQTFGDRGNGNTYGWRCPVRRTRGTNSPYGNKGDNQGGMDRGGKGLGARAQDVPFSSEYNIINNSWVQDLHNIKCPDGPGGSLATNAWEMEVPNGIYRVGALMTYTFFNDDGTYQRPNGPFTAGCAIHHTQASLNFVNGQGPRGLTYWKNVEVSNGRLQLGGSFDPGIPGGDKDDDMRCTLINAVKIIQLSDSRFPPQWLPSSGSGGAWYQQEVPANVPIGLVDIKFPRYGGGYREQNTDCRYQWMMHGDRCQYGNDLKYWENTPLGDFDGADQGFSVSVSNSPCTDGAGCAGGTVCDVVTRPQAEVHCPVCDTMKRGSALYGQDYDIDCKGASDDSSPPPHHHSVVR